MAEIHLSLSPSLSLYLSLFFVYLNLSLSFDVLLTYSGCALSQPPLLSLHAERMVVLHACYSCEFSFQGGTANDDGFNAVAMGSDGSSLFAGELRPWCWLQDGSVFVRQGVMPIDVTLLSSRAPYHTQCQPHAVVELTFVERHLQTHLVSFSRGVNNITGRPKQGCDVFFIGAADEDPRPVQIGSVSVRKIQYLRSPRYVLLFSSISYIMIV